MPNDTETNKIMFANLVMMLSSSAMQQLGKLVNPMTNKTELSLEGARMTIDMIEMLEAKSKGNLDAEEAKMIRQILSSLQMNYVETAENQQDNKKPGGKEEQEKKQ